MERTTTTDPNSTQTNPNPPQPLQNRFLNYCLTQYGINTDMMEWYTNTRNRLITSTTVDIINLMLSWTQDIVDEEILGIGYGPNFTNLIQSQPDNPYANLDQTDPDFVNKTLMIDAAYRDYLMGIIDPNFQIGFEPRMINVGTTRFRIYQQLTLYLMINSTVEIPM